MSSKTLEVTGMQAGYGAAQVLFDVSFSVREGEAITLLGRNGMGRSTTLKCLFGMIRCLDGSIHYAGTSLKNLRAYKIARKGLALVPEGRQIFPNLTVEENLVATARPSPQGTSKWDLQRVYAFFPRLHERRRNGGAALSGGEQQMLAIGRALMTNPNLLVLDEATEGLAPIIRHQIWSDLRKLRDDGLSLIIVDKNIDALLALADRHYVIEKGRTVWSGTSVDVTSNLERVHKYMTV
ncbi:MAG: ABC transporter ATP-binding protein [Castellaniella sp.]|uniref:ABC transporter ATP-binding protein n=1 Tax=Castellaniella sp. TaxID=1955812 RepID=UPI001229CF67|nr:ABC transporter ATP-binding protein [Castellaniella sp.]TAN27110.1 MAG: ABC transporter ATP-binding protein [Castellaniella sp.]